MGQSWNGPAARSLLQVARNPSLINPSKSVRDISVVNVQELKDMGIKGLVLDKDNTITAPYSLQLHPRVKHATLHIQCAFPNKVAILSNSAGTPDDCNFEEAEAIEKNLGIPVIKHLKKKPDGLKETLEFFQLETSELAVVGDRLLTDIVFGNIHGMYTIHTEVLTTENDNKFAVFFRNLENKLLLPFVKQWFKNYDVKRIK